MPVTNHHSEVRMKPIKFAIHCVLLTFIACMLASSAAADDQWQENLETSRRDKDHYYKTSPTSPMAAKDRLVVKANEGETVFLDLNERELVQAKKAGLFTRFSVHKEKKGWKWLRHNSGITFTSGKVKLKSGTLLPARADAKIGDLLIRAYPVDDGLVLQVFDPERPEIKNFKHLYYFPPDKKYAVAATLHKFEKIEKFTVLTSQNLKKNYHRYARIKFKLEGKELQLTAFKFALEGENSKYLFIPFADGTSGKESYEVGRFLELEEPKRAQFILDFNTSYNPLCNYSPAYNCPIPPLENCLQVPIRAGEKTFPH